MSSKSVNPRRIPATQADVDKAFRKGISEGLESAMAMFFTAMLDGNFLEVEEIPAAWKKVEYVADSVSKGYINVYEQKKMLLEEYKVDVGKITL